MPQRLDLIFNENVVENSIQCGAFMCELWSDKKVMKVWSGIEMIYHLVITDIESIKSHNKKFKIFMHLNMFLNLLNKSCSPTNMSAHFYKYL